VALQWVDPADAMAGVQPFDGLDVVEVLQQGVGVPLPGRGMAPIVTPAPRNALDGVSLVVETGFNLPRQTSTPLFHKLLLAVGFVLHKVGPTPNGADGQEQT